MGYSLIHSAYCGMRVPLLETNDREEARKRVAARLRYCRRQGCKILTHAVGEEWEACEPPNVHLVPDFCGTIRLKTTPEPENEDAQEEEDFHPSTFGEASGQ